MTRGFFNMIKFDKVYHYPPTPFYRKGERAGGNVADRSLVLMDPGWMQRFGSLPIRTFFKLF